jgi:hypothetical protein
MLGIIETFCYRPFGVQQERNAAMIRRIGYLACLVALAGCAHHPVDCAVGFYHTDCLPGTAGYDDPAAFATVDNTQCQSYGLLFGTNEYAMCRQRLAAQHQGQEPAIGVLMTVPVHR